MKLTYVGYCEERSFDSAEEAVAFQIEKDATLCDGALERVTARADALAGIVGRLMDNACGPKAAAQALGVGWEGIV